MLSYIRAKGIYLYSASMRSKVPEIACGFIILRAGGYDKKSGTGRKTITAPAAVKYNPDMN